VQLGIRQRTDRAQIESDIGPDLEDRFGSRPRPFEHPCPHGCEASDRRAIGLVARDVVPAVFAAPEVELRGSWNVAQCRSAILTLSPLCMSAFRACATGFPIEQEIVLTLPQQCLDLGRFKTFALRVPFAHGAIWPSVYGFPINDSGCERTRKALLRNRLARIVHLSSTRIAPSSAFAARV
jgi:hypothetical protein